MKATRLGLGALAALLGSAAVPAAEPVDACATFSWNVGHERALFAEAPQSLAAGKAVASAPALRPDRLYRLQLVPQSQVSFAAPPGTHHPSSEGAYAGLALVTLAQAGTYRISLDQAAWVDVLANGTALRAQDHQGRPGCNAPHKIVEFSLPAGTVTLQFSANTASTLEVALSPRS